VTHPLFTHRPMSLLHASLGGLVIIQKRNEPNLLLHLTEGNIRFFESCIVLSTSNNSLSKYHGFWLFFSQNMGTFVHFSKRTLCTCHKWLSFWLWQWKISTKISFCLVATMLNSAPEKKLQVIEENWSKIFGTPILTI